MNKEFDALSDEFARIIYSQVYEMNQKAKEFLEITKASHEKVLPMTQSWLWLYEMEYIYLIKIYLIFYWPL